MVDVIELVSKYIEKAIDIGERIKLTKIFSNKSNLWFVIH
jgi:hypothetical protein